MCYYVASKLSTPEMLSIEQDFVTQWEEEEREDLIMCISL